MAGRDILAGSAYVQLLLRDAKFLSGLKGAGAKLKGFAKVAGNAALLAGTGFAAFSVGAFKGFDDKMRLVKAVTGATGEEFAKLTEEAKRLGRTTSFTAQQVASAMVEMGRAGFDSSEIEKSTADVLNLSRSTGTELARATEIAGAALRGFNLDASEMGRVADVMTAAANGSAQTLDDLFESMKVVAPIASEAGEGIEDTAAALAILANNGIKGSLAGSALARAYKNLSADKTADDLKSIGVAAADSAGNLKPISQLIGEIGVKTQSMGEADRLAIFEKLFGRGQAAALKLAQATGGEFQHMLDLMKNSGGIAEKTAVQMDGGIGGALRRLLSAAEGIAIALGELLAPAISSMAAGLTTAAGYVSSFVETLTTGFAEVYIAVEEEFGAIGEIISNLWGWIGETTGELFGWFKEVVINALLGVSFASKNWRLVMNTALVGAYLSVVQFANGTVHFFSEVLPAWLDWFGEHWYEVFIDIAELTKTVASNIWENLKNLWDAITGLLAGDGFEFEWTGLTEGFKSAITELPEIAKRELGPLEKELQSELNTLADEVAKGYEEHVQNYEARVAKFLPKKIEKAATEAKKGTDKVLKATPAGDGKITTKKEVLGSFSLAALAASAGRAPEDKIVKAIKESDEKAKVEQEKTRKAIKDGGKLGK